MAFQNLQENPIPEAKFTEQQILNKKNPLNHSIQITDFKRTIINSSFYSIRRNIDAESIKRPILMNCRSSNK